MNKKILFAAIALCAGAFAHAGVVGNVDVSKFSAATVEHFSATPVTASSYDFGNGMTYANLVNQSELINHDQWYDLGDSGFAMGGYDDAGYFATQTSPTTFQFAFASGVTRFGFYGAERVQNGSADEDGFMNVQFYDMNDVLMDSLVVDSTGLFMWDAFHGFESEGAAIGRVVFNGVGGSVFDEVSFQSAAAAVPEPGSIALLGLGLAGFAVARRKPARK